MWYVLHGYRQLADRFIERFRPIATPERLIVAPEALNRFYLDDDASLRAHSPDSPVGATWMTRLERDAEIADYVAYLDALDRALGLPRAVRRIVLGFSQGSATAARWAMLGRRRPTRLVLWGGLFPNDPPVEEYARRVARMAPVLVRSEQDPSLATTRVDAELERLVALGIPATGHAHAGGHTIGRDALIELARAVDP
ncbi:MAG TPA: hypothetical protein VF039_02660 [Longimicrobiales bacterium]